VTDPCYLYEPGFIDASARSEILAWLATVVPLWEQRYSTRRPPPPGRQQRPLLRPVYWLGNWQFACLGYYEPPRRTRGVAVAAEPFPPVLARLVARIERRVQGGFPPQVVPRRWRLNTCLVNFYGDRIDGDRVVDVARVGDHRDFEPGPVGSLSLGERARFQFVRRGAPHGGPLGPGRRGAASPRSIDRPGSPHGGSLGPGRRGAPSPRSIDRPRSRDAPPVRTEWLDDGSLQVFGGPRWKDDLLHRVQRVEDKHALDLPPAIAGFRTRRVNFTFRYVPDEHVVAFADLPADARDDVRGYVATLAGSSAFFAAAIAAERSGPPARVTG
jgi:alkylated DNA repair dioxygenase AlkB